ncbi:hypothetical protein IPG36_07630 [bacterium]|nr:MAG: hypothetical protein IPG36_07630 [bacterium]
MSRYLCARRTKFKQTMAIRIGYPPLYYCFVGIAKVGDKVKVKGKQLSKDEIAIFSPNCAEEYIEPIDCDPLGIIEANFATARV